MPRPVRITLVVLGAAMAVYGAAGHAGPEPGLARLSTLVGALGLAYAAVWPRLRPGSVSGIPHVRALLPVSGVGTAGVVFVWPFT